MVSSDEGIRKRKVCVFLLQLGGPQHETEIEPFLRNLFEDVLPGPAWLKRPLARIIANRRTPHTAQLYRAIGGGSPLRAHTEAQANALELELTRRDLTARVLVCMRYAPPRAVVALEEARLHFSDADWVALPLYPQYSTTTTRSSLDELYGLMTTPEQTRTTNINAYPTEPRYIDAMCECVEEALARFPSEELKDVHLLFSAHGLPLRLVKHGDPYPEHVQQTVDRIVDKLPSKHPVHLSYQSRVGPVRWLEPSTEAKVRELGTNGVKKLLLVPVSFVSEHLETLHELDIQLAQLATKVGVEQLERAPTPGVRPAFIESLAKLVVRVLPRHTSSSAEA